jgi:4-hydroxy-4-methyl-2-oxoglutarate aldolase
MFEKELTGRIARDRIVLMAVPRLPEGVVEAFRALGDASSVVSDTLDELGLPGALPASTFRPTLPGVVIAGPALTVRNVAAGSNPAEAAREKRNGMAEYEAHNLATPGDVLVVEGVPAISNMGGLSAQAGNRQGEAGAIVSGGIRDLSHSRRMGYFLWSTEVKPITGKWRLETVEINGEVQVGGVRVHCGDLVLADDTGVCFVPRARAAEVLAIAQSKVAGETARAAAFDSGLPLPEVLRMTVA